MEALSSTTLICIFFVFFFNFNFSFHSQFALKMCEFVHLSVCYSLFFIVILFLFYLLFIRKHFFTTTTKTPPRMRTTAANAAHTHSLSLRLAPDSLFAFAFCTLPLRVQRTYVPTAPTFDAANCPPHLPSGNVRRHSRLLRQFAYIHTYSYFIVCWDVPTHTPLTAGCRLPVAVEVRSLNTLRVSQS